MPSPAPSSLRRLRRTLRWLLSLLLLSPAVVRAVPLPTAGRVPYSNSPDPALEAALLRSSPGYVSVPGRSAVLQEVARYVHAAIDLDGDGRSETFVYLMGSWFCGSGGCNLLLFRGTPRGPVPLADLPTSRMPVVVSPERRHGWRSFWRLSSGGGAPPTWTLHRFDGRRYQAAATRSAALGTPSGTAVLVGQAGFDDGAPLLPPLPGSGGLPSCPPAVTAQIEGLYRWLVSRQNSPGERDLSGQRLRFTPELLQRLQRAFALTPADGAFLDFDVFSGTQVGLFGATVQGCRSGGGTSLEALVAVRVGLSSRGLEPTPRLLRVRMLPDPVVGWQIADILYPEPAGFRLSSVLEELLGPPR